MRKDQPDQINNVLLITIDALRHDAPGYANGSKLHTPNMDALAARGYVFTQCISAADCTDPSLASLHLSAYPPDHGVIAQAMRLPKDRPTLAEVVAASGRRCGGFSSVEHVSREFGFSRGFHDFSEVSRVPWLYRLIAQHRQTFWLFDAARRRLRVLPQHFLPADKVTLRIVSWLRQRERRGQQWFAWVHYFDAHEYPDGARREYEKKIESIDRHIGRLMGSIRPSGSFDRTAVLLTADHGEGWGEHGFYRHGVRLYDEFIRVPLVICLPGQDDPARIDAQVRSIDVAPTIVDILGLEAPDCWRGVSLIPWIRGHTKSSLDACSYGLATRVDTKVLRTQRWKYVHYRDEEPAVFLTDNNYMPPGSPHPHELYDLQEDPEEAHNLFADDPRTVEELRAHFFELENSKRQISVDYDARAIELLTALGYLD